ncbi:DUF4145 domain-containing protein [Bacillus haynesii]|uniref:DUF4145 domain-containing protein n=1 Tax=Bacillus haynesii TaxID=1925021 RepID=UPI00227DD332|nr:DUF4145 domain-containing protein [Bacillus haynesii]MCY8346165.1 DUF4145 domain-containing protein [Bacillus haynesii]MCY8558534.1 DUF4145 domain-containing protein [Bacillus haynesii]MEC0753590.1 DUF4145 domain-containing protein [Bacillus haynesii]MEC1533771.1 DUF4145 domain-containing protein [Bacillus haynesii]
MINQIEQNYVPPKYGSRRFNCPSCSAFSGQKWFEGLNSFDVIYLEPSLREVTGEEDQFIHIVNGHYNDNVFAISFCIGCEKPSFWIEGKLVYPQRSSVPFPHSDMPEEIKKLYNEARSIVTMSPRASVAILRLAVEKILPLLGAKKGKINDMIGELVGKGLPHRIQMALDSLRVIGNEAVHPGKIDLDGIDGKETAVALFGVLNFVVEKMLTEPREIEDIYSLLPDSTKKGIDERDNKALTKQ